MGILDRLFGGHHGGSSDIAVVVTAGALPLAVTPWRAPAVAADTGAFVARCCKRSTSFYGHHIAQTSTRPSGDEFLQQH